MSAWANGDVHSMVLLHDLCDHCDDNRIWINGRKYLTLFPSLSLSHSLSLSLSFPLSSIFFFTLLLGTQLIGFTVFSFIYAIFCYAIISHWMWSPNGWLGAYQENPPITTFGYTFSSLEFVIIRFFFFFLADD